MSISDPRDLCRGVQSSEIDAVWGTAAPLIQKALDRGSNYTLQQIYDGLKDASMQLWMWRDEAALVTTIQQKRGKTFCLLLALGGTSMSVWLQQLPDLENWAKTQGAQEMRVYGRKGWSRLPGYDIEHVKLVKAL